MPQMSLEQFGQQIKSKHPEYGDMADADVGRRVLAKFPQYSDMVTPPPTPAEAKGLFERMGDNWRSNTQLRPSDGSVGTALHNFGAAAASTLEQTVAHPIDTLRGAIAAVPGAPMPVIGDDGEMRVGGERPADMIDQFRADRAASGTAQAVEKLAGSAAAQAVLGGAMGAIGAGAGPLRAKAIAAVRSGGQATLGLGRYPTMKAAGRIAADASAAYDKTRASNQKVAELTELDRAKVDRRNEKLRDEHAAAVQKNRATNEANAEAHRQATAAVEEHNQSLVSANTGREATQTQIEEHAGELDQRLLAAKAKGRALTGALYDTVREKTANASTSNDAIRDAVDAARANQPVASPIFDAILKQSGPTQPLRAVIDQFGEKVNPFDPDYEDLYAEQHGVAAPNIDGINGQVGYDQLHRFNAYLNHVLGKNRGTLETGQYNALKDVQKAVEGSIQEIVKQAGADGDLQAARQEHSHFKRAFDDSPTVRNTNMRQSLKETAPEYVEAKAKSERREAQARYDAGLPELHGKIDGLRARHKQLKGVKGELKLPPEAPVPTPDPEAPAEIPYTDPVAEAKQRVGATPFARPDLDLRGIRREKLEKTAQKFGLTGYDIGVLASSTLISPLMDMLGVAGGHAFRATGYAYVGGKVLASRLLEHPAVIRFLTEPHPEEIEALNHLRGVDKTRVITKFHEAAEHARKQGRPLRIAPATAAFLAQGQNAPTSTANLPQNAGEAKQRVASLR